jgi:hypothetical protein
MAADTTITREAGTVDVDVGMVMEEDINKAEDIRIPHLSMEYPIWSKSVWHAATQLLCKQNPPAQQKKYFKNWIDTGSLFHTQQQTIFLSRLSLLLLFIQCRFAQIHIICLLVDYSSSES